MDGIHMATGAFWKTRWQQMQLPALRSTSNFPPSVDFNPTCRDVCDIFLGWGLAHASSRTVARMVSHVCCRTRTGQRPSNHNALIITCGVRKLIVATLDGCYDFVDVRIGKTL